MLSAWNSPCPHTPDINLTAGEGIESEPFRLYNLDVFEYEHDSQFGLYGSIPYVISHKPGATVGAFWCVPKCNGCMSAM